MPRFVVQHHQVNESEEHWDLMLEDGDALATWQVPEPPAQWGKMGICRELSPHRKAYLTWQGPISSGRGQVAIVAGGEFTTILRNENLWRLRLAGGRISGLLELSRIDLENWRLLLSE